MSNNIIVPKESWTIGAAFTDEKIENGVLVVQNNIIKAKEFYPLDKRPSDQSGLVEIQRRDALGAIDLDQLLFQLSLCADLYEIVYHSVNGIAGLHANVGQLRIRFSDTLRQSDSAAYEFKQKTAIVTETMLLAFRHLIKNKKSSALLLLGDIANIAEKMVIKCGELKEAFEKLKDDTSAKLYDVTSKNEEFYKKREELKKAEENLTASLAGFTSLVKTYKEKSDELQSQIDEVKSDKKKQEDRAFTLAIVGAITGVVKDVATAVASASSPINLTMSAPNNTSTTSNGGSAPKTSEQQTRPPEEVVKNYTAANAKCKELHKTITEINERLSQIDKVLTEKSYAAEEVKDISADKKKDTEKTEKELINEKDELTKKKNASTTELSNEENKAKTFRDSLAALGCAFDTLTGDLKEMRETAKETAGNLDTELRNLRSDKKAIDMLYAENLSKMKEASEKIKNSVNDQKDVSVAIDSLILAITALNNIIAFLGIIATFWERVKISCATLKDGITKIAGLVEIDDDFLDELFVFPYFRSLAYWVALHLIFTKYAAVASSTNKQMAESIKKQEMPREEHWKAARVLAKEVFDKLGVEIAAVTNRTDN